MFSKILIANRGEIALRVIRTAKQLEIRTVAIYSKSDSNALHVRQADEAYFIGEDKLSESYLNIEKIISVAKKAKCEAIHPGYGFLSENPDFAEACEKAGIVFIGPDKDIIRKMGNKIEANQFVKSIGVPTIENKIGDKEYLLNEAAKMDFPILLKAAAGGGGKGMRIVRKVEELTDALESTSREALNYFGNDSVYAEKYIENPRHIEVQILGDTNGDVIHLFERECSIQRRYQKIIEEAPSITLNEEVRQKNL
jgi:3-methylcrotonyl-CoA carboxylase alpha subunit